MYFSFVAWPMTMRSNFVMTMNEDAVLSLVKYNSFEGISDNNFKETQK